MALVTWQGTIQNDEGQPVASASIEVRSTAAGTPLATLYSDAAGTSLANPFTTNADGFGQFFVQPGEYTIAATSGGSTQTWTVQLSTDDFSVDDAAEFFAGNLPYTAGTVISSRKEGFAWEAVASGGDVQNAGGQRFDVQPQNGVTPMLALNPAADGVTNDAAIIDAINVSGRVVDLGGRSYEYGGTFTAVATFQNGRITDDNRTFDYTTLTANTNLP